MARAVYGQSPGNPYQQGRLPRQPSGLASSCGPRAGDSDQSIAGNIVCWLGLLNGFLLLTALLHHLLGIGWKASPLVWLGIWLMSFVVRFVLRVINARPATTRPDRILFPLGAGFYLLTLLPLPIALHVLINAALLVVLIWQFARHWMELCLTSPVRRDVKAQLRRRWQQYLALNLTIATGVCVAAVYSRSTMMWFLVVALGLTFGIIPLLQNARRTISMVAEAMTSWLAYNRQDQRIPGVFCSPSGGFHDRLLLTGACVCLTTITFVRWPAKWTPGAPDELPVPFFSAASETLRWIIPGGAFEGTMLWFMAWALGYAVVLATPLSIVLLVPPLFTQRLLLEAGRYRVREITPDKWKPLVEQIRSSTDPIERNSVYMGRIVEDGSPLLVPRDVFHEHAHFLGDSGSGKTSMGLAPWMEQMITGCDCSVVIVDLKADSHELLATADAAAKERSQLTGCPVPVRHFSNQASLSTFAFNPLMQSWFQSMEHYVRTDILCGALGLSYGSDYGEGFYSSANAAVLYHTIKKFPETSTFRELADRLGQVAISSDKRELHPEIRKAGVHVQTVLDRLGSFEALNVTAKTHSAEVLDASIDFRDVFTQPQVLYFHLSATLGPGSSPEIARLVAYSLLAASTQTQRKHQVFLVVDEFQRMVARNIEYMLQLARSMGVGVIIANQSMQDLKTSKADLIPTIEANCRYRQWFAVSAHEDRDRLIKSSGETIDVMQNITETASPRARTSVAFPQFIDTRLTANDVLLASDNPYLNIVKLSRGAGYAQYGGMPVIAESNFHITHEEFERRKRFPWPDATGGAFVPGSRDYEPAAAPVKSGPVVSTEVIGDTDAQSGGSGLLDSWMQEKQKTAGPVQPRQRRKRKKG